MPSPSTFSHSTTLPLLPFLFWFRLNPYRPAPLPFSPTLLPFPQPSCQKSKILFPLTEPKNPCGQINALHFSLWSNLKSLKKSKSPSSISGKAANNAKVKNHQIFHLSLLIWRRGFVIYGDYGLDCGFCGFGGLWVLWVVMEVVGCGGDYGLWRFWVVVEVVSCFAVCGKCLMVVVGCSGGC